MLLAVQVLLDDVNNADPAQEEAYRFYKNDKNGEYQRRVKLQVATPLLTLVPTLTLTQTPTPTHPMLALTVVLTPTPTLIPTPTPTLTLTLTLTLLQVARTRQLFAN